MINYSKITGYIVVVSLLYCVFLITIILLNNNSTGNYKNLLNIESIQNVSKSVVGIHVTQLKKEKINNPWQRYWGKYQRVMPIQNMGSGLILDKNGYIVTNYHVIEDASEIIVKIYGGESFNVDLDNIFFDELTDIAIIKLDGKDFKVPNIGNSDNIQVGEEVIALGNPLGLFDVSNEPTATKGIISARNINFGLNERIGSVYQNMIQTDASINPGNSGGPLLNLKGEIIGINTFIITGSDSHQGSVGLNFAIPINHVMDIFKDLKSKGYIDRKFNTGVKVRKINDLIMKYRRLDSTQGVLVVDVEKKSSGEKAGLEIGDVILKVNGRSVNSLKNIKNIIDEDLLRSGDKINLLVLRDDVEIDINLLLEKGSF
ncbi:MAG: hypothetical protein CBD97_01270 [Pelagibacteraceae bacterium TMED237]|nr:2-alkenal reductase [Candidatus Neomarinimicrobiota bacterium]OUW96625.1 MAG: hypothetical protein CBD97_01270 [Pelagibacteraceae bacterium TMED237]|tara:strand:- start:3715 stop:4833 length:1119 start_codon:yes stop_codon:yes gene_type:complete